MRPTPDRDAADAHAALAACHRLFASGAMEAAAQRIAEAMLRHPEHEALLHLGAVIAAAQRDYRLARQRLERSLALAPHSAEKWSNLASIALREGQPAEALRAARRALDIDPRHLPSRCNLAEALIATEEPEAALKEADAALALDRDYAPALAARGRALSDLDRLPQALQAFDLALKRAPNNPITHNNRGVALGKAGQAAAAIRSHEQALALDPQFHDARINLARNLADLGRHEAALQQLAGILRAAPEHAEAHFNLARILLESGSFAAGWPEYEWRFRAPSCASRRLASNRPEWDGAPTAQRLLVYPEQGVGDQLLFCSMLRDVQRLAPHLLVAVDPRLIAPLRRCMPEIEFVSRDIAPSELSFDIQTPLGSLGRFVRQDVKDFAAVSPWLAADPARTQDFRERLARGRPLIGISWLSRNARLGQAKSLALADLVRALAPLQADLLVLQYGDVAAEVAALTSALGGAERAASAVIVPEHLDRTDDLDGVLAAASACDLVLTVSNTVAHLAGAAGLNTLLMTPAGRGRFWYWRTTPDQRSLWYPSVQVLPMTSPQMTGTQPPRTLAAAASAMTLAHSPRSR